MNFLFHHFIKIPAVIVMLFIGALCYGQAQEIPEWKPETKQLNKMLKKLRGLNKGLGNEQGELNHGELLQEGSSQVIPNKDSLEDDLIKSLTQHIDSMKVSSEFAMGQEETIRLSKKLEELRQELAIAKTNLKALGELNTESLQEKVPSDRLERMNQKKSEYERLFKSYQTELESLDESLEKYVLEHPKVKAFQEDYLRNKGLEAEAFGFRLDTKELQTFDKVEKIISDRIGGTKEEIGDLVAEKVADATTELEELKSKISSDLEKGIERDANGKQKPVPFAEKLNFSTNISVLRGDPAALDLTVNVGYRLSGPLSIGVGGVYRTALGTGWDEINFQTQGWGYRAFSDYQLTNKFFIEFAYESYNKSQSSASNIGVGDSENTHLWQDATLLGVGVQQPISKGFNAHLLLLYNITQRNSQFSSPFIIRFGIGLRKNQK